MTVDRNLKLRLKTTIRLSGGNVPSGGWWLGASRTPLVGKYILSNDKVCWPGLASQPGLARDAHKT